MNIRKWGDLSRKILPIVTLAILVVSILALASSVRLRGENTNVRLFVTPSMYVAEQAGEVFDVGLNVSGVLDLHRVQLSVTYNTSLLDVVQVEEGSLFPSPPTSSFAANIVEPLGLINIDVSFADAEASADGEGTLALVTFRAIYTAEPRAGGPIFFENSLLFDSSGGRIDHACVGGVYFWRSLVPDPPEGTPVIDLYTQRGGVGREVPGGKFFTGETVLFISRVTYNGVPVQQKLVAIEIHDPLDTGPIFRSSVTDQEGYAVISL
jgi:hypothetical protein